MKTFCDRSSILHSAGWARHESYTHVSPYRALIRSLCECVSCNCSMSHFDCNRHGDSRIASTQGAKDVDHRISNCSASISAKDAANQHGPDLTHMSLPCHSSERVQPATKRGWVLPTSLMCVAVGQDMDISRSIYISLGRDIDVALLSPLCMP